MSTSPHVLLYETKPVPFFPKQLPFPSLLLASTSYTCANIPIFCRGPKFIYFINLLGHMKHPPPQKKNYANTWYMHAYFSEEKTPSFHSVLKGSMTLSSSERMDVVCHFHQYVLSLCYTCNIEAASWLTPWPLVSFQYIRRTNATHCSITQSQV